MSALRTLIDQAVGEVIAEHPSYFTPRGLESARAAFVRKIIAAIRASTSTKAEADAAAANTPAPPEPPKPMMVARNSREGIAYSTLRQMAGCVPPFVANDGRICVPPECTVPAVWALADTPSRDHWPFVSDRRQIGAWQEFFRETLRDTPRREVCGVEASGEGERWGMRAPWPWPPRKDGTLSPHGAHDGEDAAA